MVVHVEHELSRTPLVVDDTALPRKGTRSVGVVRQCSSALGKQANCQSLVSLTLARGEVPVPVGLRLFLPRGVNERSAAVRAGRRGAAAH